LQVGASVVGPSVWWKHACDDQRHVVVLGQVASEVVHGFEDDPAQFRCGAVCVLVETSLTGIA
jgi:hypothetical protein